MKRDDIKTAISNLAELFKMIEYKANTDEYVSSMKQYIVNPLAYLHAKDIQQCSRQSEPERNRYETALKVFEEFLNKSDGGINGPFQQYCRDMKGERG